MRTESNHGRQRCWEVRKLGLDGFWWVTATSFRLAVKAALDRGIGPVGGLVLRCAD